MSDRLHSAYLICVYCNSYNINVPITVLVIVYRMCEPCFCLLVTVLIYIVYLFVCTVIFVSLLLTVSPTHSLRECLVSSMPSGCEGGVFTHGMSLSASSENRFRAVNMVRQVSLVGSELQQTAVPGCCDFLRRIGNYRAGKCWNLTGTGTLMCCIFSSCLVWI